MEKVFIIKEFIKNFVIKDRRDRVEFQLSNSSKRDQFIQKLNHSYAEVLDMRRFKILPNTQDDFEYIKSELGIRSQDQCYVISNYDDIDDCFLELETAFSKSYGRGFATLIINLQGDKLYLETEETGHQHRFTGLAGQR